MSRAQAESVIKNIIREIAQECAVKGQAVSETLVAFMVKAVSFWKIFLHYIKKSWNSKILSQNCVSKLQFTTVQLRVQIILLITLQVVLDPDNQFNVERTLTKDDVQKLIKTCVDRLLLNNSPSLDTIKMQVC